MGGGGTTVKYIENPRLYDWDPPKRRENRRDSKIRRKDPEQKTNLTSRGRKENMRYSLVSEAL